MIVKRIAKEIREIAKDKTIKEDKRILKILEAIYQNASEYNLITFKHSNDEIYKLLLTDKDNNITIELN